MTQSSIGQRSDGVINYGDVSGALTVDLAYSAIAFNATGNVTLTFINEPSSGVNRPIAFYITRATASGAQITWPVNVTFNTAFEPHPVDGQTMVASVSTINGGSSYIGFANASVYEVTGSGLATSWNPSDYYGTPLALTNSNKTIEWAGAGATQYRSARGFGGKTSGKWRIAVRCDVALVGSTGVASEFDLGVADGSLLLNSAIGANATSYGLYIGKSSTANCGKRSANVMTAYTAFSSAVNDIYGALVDLDNNKIWFTKNSTVLSGGNPESGTTPDYTLNSSPTYFPACSLYEQTASQTSGIWTLLNEVQDPYASTWPSFQNWTA